MKTKNIFATIFGIAFLVLALTPIVSAGIWFDFEADPSATSMTVTQGQNINLVLTASSHNLIPVSSEKLEAVSVGTIAQWNEPGVQYSFLNLWTKTYTLNTNALGVGTFTLKFSAQTSAGLESQTLILIINPTDTTAPVITLLGTTPLTIALGSVYIDAGATAWDNINGVITANIVTVNPVNTAVLGTYVVTYNVQDGAGNSAIQVTRTVIVSADTTAPVITMLGITPVTIAVGSVYTDAGATAFDNIDGVITANIVTVNSVNTAVAGTYTVTYNVQDSAGNSAVQVVRTVIVSSSTDINAPTIVISSPIAQTYNTAVTNITYIPTDAEGNLNKCWYSLDGGVTNSTAVSCTNAISNLFSGLVPLQGSNTWTVWANDTAGNLGIASVTFTVNDLIDPVITAVAPINNETLDDTDVTLKVSTNEDAVVQYSINGAANVTMTQTSNYAFQSALLNLNDDEEYTVVYTATDIMGNVASLTIKFKIDEDASDNEDNDLEDTTFDTDDLDGITIEPAIDLTDEEASGLNWWQKFVNWLCRLLGLEEVY